MLLVSFVEEHFTAKNDKRVFQAYYVLRIRSEIVQTYDQPKFITTLFRCNLNLGLFVLITTFLY